MEKLFLSEEVIFAKELHIRFLRKGLNNLRR